LIDKAVRKSMFLTISNCTSKQLDILIPYGPKITNRSKESLKPTTQGDQSMHGASYANTRRSQEYSKTDTSWTLLYMREKRTQDIHTL